MEKAENLRKTLIERYNNNLLFGVEKPGHLYIENFTFEVIKGSHPYQVHKDGYMISIVSFRHDKSFDYAKLKLYGIDIVSISAFAQSKLAFIDLGDVFSIEGHTFFDCEDLKIVKGPNLRYIGKGSFEDCYDLEVVKFPKVLHGAPEIFYCCYSLSNISLPKLREVPSHMFKDSKVANMETALFDLSGTHRLCIEAFDSCTLGTVNLSALKFADYDAFNKCKVKECIINDEIYSFLLSKDSHFPITNITV